MQNSTNQPSTSDLQPTSPVDEVALDEMPESVEEEIAASALEVARANDNIRVEVDVVDELDETPPVDEAVVVDGDGDEVAEGEVELSTEIATPVAEPDTTLDEPPPAEQSPIAVDSETELQPLPPPPSKTRPEAEVAPIPVATRGAGRRSVRMQLRYTRSLLWALGLLVRILFWEWIVKRVMGEAFVQRRNVARWKQYARDLRNFAADMGGVFIKAGQFISTRADIFPEEIIMELAGLQDEIPSVPFKKIDGVLRAELGDDYNKHFSWLREEPIAAASLGQVHRAKLTNGDRVVVKVQRPGIVNIVDTDLAALKVISHIAMRFKFISRRANAVEISEEFGRVLWEEVSYLKEAENARRFSRMFQNDMNIYIPMVYNDYSTDRVLLMEDVTSIKVNDYERLEAAGISRSAIAHRLMDSYLQQVFDNQFFHADPHPGNLFVYPLPVDDENADFGPDGRPFYLIYIDFGMTGALTQQIVDGLVSTLIAVVNRDAGSLIKSYKELDLLLPGADLERLEAATKAAFDQVWGMDMNDLSNVDYEVMEQLGTEFSDLLFDMPFQMPQNFIYLARTMGILSGMCTSMDPRFNPWVALQPYADKMMRLRAQDGTTVGGSLMTGLFGASNLFEAGTKIITRAVAPTAANNQDIMRALKSGDIRVTTEPSRKWQLQMRFLEIQIRIVMRAVLFTGFLISSTLLLVNGFTLIAGGGYIVCVMIGWRIMFPPNVLQ
jgi:predicted unusual protein kinase regulating ubiquinone biosynthesis (AarF/ABC1/UbiB family)